jgi:hypothetical protein
LKGARQTTPGNLMGFSFGDVLTIKDDLTGSDRVQSRYTVKQRGFAGPVRPD